MESDNPWVAMMMKSFGDDSSIKESMTDEAIKGMVNSMLGKISYDQMGINIIRCNSL